MPCSCLYLSKDLKCLCLYFSSAMISKSVIVALYKKYSTPPEEISCLGLDEFVSLCGDLYSIELDNDSITFGQMSDDNPFRRILLRNIYGIEFFAYHIALVSSSYILFFNREPFRYRRFFESALVLSICISLVIFVTDKD